MNINDFGDKFQTTLDCELHLSSVIWRDGRKCPHCGHFKSWKLNRACVLTVYECAACNKSFTVITKTPLHSTKLPLKKWLLAMYLMITAPKGVSSVVMADWIGTSQKTAWKIGHAIREMMNQDLFAASRFVGEIEFDEKYAGGKPRKRQKQGPNYERINDKMPIMVIAERNGRIAARATDRFLKDRFYPFACCFVDKEAKTYSDEHVMYKACDSVFGGHESVNHSLLQYVSGSAHNNTCESFNALLERQYVGTHHNISKKHMQRYVDELAFKWNAKVDVETATFLVGRKPKIRPLQAIAKLLESCFMKQLRRTVNGGIEVLTQASDFPDSYANQPCYWL